MNANARLEAFCDGVFAIALTLLIIDIKLPSGEAVGSTIDLWRALQHLAPATFAFVLSFVVIFITWVNHRAALEMVDESSAGFIYANGFLLLTVVFIPFPTLLLGEFLWTEQAAPAVALYDAVLAVQAVAWIVLGRSALRSDLTRDASSAAALAHNTKHGYGAVALYALLAVTALWAPRSAALATAVSWTVWLILSLRSTPLTVGVAESLP